MSKYTVREGKEFYEHLNILDNKCAVLLRLSGLLLGLNVIPTALKQLAPWTKLFNAIAVFALLLTALLSLTVIWVDWVPDERTLSKRTRIYKGAVVAAGAGLVAMGIVTFTLLAQ